MEESTKEKFVRSSGWHCGCGASAWRYAPRRSPPSSLVSGYIRQLALKLIKYSFSRKIADFGHFAKKSKKLFFRPKHLLNRLNTRFWAFPSQNKKIDFWPKKCKNGQNRGFWHFLRFSKKWPKKAIFGRFAMAQIFLFFRLKL